MTERATDKFIYSLLEQAGINYDPDGSTIKEVEEALKTASKRQTGNVGHPEFTAKIGDFLIVGEDKESISNQAKYIDESNSELDTSIEATTDYAENGALHYARHIIRHTSFKKVFAFGCSGNEKHYRIRPIFVNADCQYKVLKEVDNFENFNADNINKYYQH